MLINNSLISKENELKFHFKNGSQNHLQQEAHLPH